VITVIGINASQFSHIYCRFMKSHSQNVGYTGKIVETKANTKTERETGGREAEWRKERMKEMKEGASCEGRVVLDPTRAKIEFS
jgi:hypothetical protein